MFGKEKIVALIIALIFASASIIVMIIPKMFDGSADIKLTLIAVVTFILSSVILKFGFLKK